MTKEKATREIMITEDTHKALEEYKAQGNKKTDDIVREGIKAEYGTYKPIEISNELYKQVEAIGKHKGISPERIVQEAIDNSHEIGLMKGALIIEKNMKEGKGQERPQ